MATKKSCLKCSRLQHCRLRDRILDPTIPTCNYAKEGCVHYNGFNKTKSDKDRILDVLKCGEVVTFADIHAKTGMPIADEEDKQLIWNYINRLIKEGHNIEKIKVPKKRGISYLLK